MPMAFPMLLKSSVDWDLFGEPEPGLGGPAAVPPARQGGRRIGLDQRDDLRPRQPRRLRRLGGRRGHGLELRRGAALLQALRGQRARRGRVPRRRWADQRVGQPLDDPAGRHDARGERARGPRATPRTSTARARTASDASRARSATDGATRPRPPSCTRPSRGRTWRSSPTRWRCASCSTATRAVGVEVARDGKVEEIRAGREVILSAGSYQSPVLLMLSGIGPAEDLERFGMPVRENLPVGHDLQDHCMCQLNYEVDEPSMFGIFTPENFELFEREGRGPLTSGYPEAAAFFRTRSGLEAPDMQFHYSRLDVLRRGADRAARQRLLLRPGRDQAVEPRARDAAHADGGLEAARAVQLPHDRGGPRSACSPACGWRWRSPSRSRSRR